MVKRKPRFNFSSEECKPTALVALLVTDFQRKANFCNKQQFYLRQIILYVFIFINYFIST